MNSPMKSKILIIDPPQGLVRTAVMSLFDGMEAVCEVCDHLYEAVSILADMPAERPVIAAGAVGELIAENGSFFSFLAKHPNFLCISLDPIGLDWPYFIRQAVWRGQLLICRTPEEMQQAFRWALDGRGVRESQPSAAWAVTPPAQAAPKAELHISPEELDALFNPE